MSDRVGQHLGNYRLVNLLGQGGYAEVYLGQHVRLNQQAAIKVLHAHLTEQEAEHFQQEAQTIATLIHPGIVRVFGYDVQDGVPFLVIDYAPGGTLRRRYPKGSLVPLPVILSSVKQVAEALQYAHEQKFIHRDVKPENMLLGRRQEVLLSDFGIATIAHSTSSLNIGSEGASGTLAYMAPEQIEGHPRAASDQYALGVVVYEWLCGERPFEGSASEVMAQHLSVPPVLLRERLPSIPGAIEQVVFRALAKDPKARFTSVVDFAAALEQAGQRALSSTAKHADEQPAFGVGDAQGYETVLVEPGQSKLQTELTPSADLSAEALDPTIYPDVSTPHKLNTPQSEATQSGQVLAPTVAMVTTPLEPTMPVKQKARRLSRRSAALLIGLTVVIIFGGILGSASLLTHLGMLGSHTDSNTPTGVRGGTWTDDLFIEPDSFIPNGSPLIFSTMIDQALYLPLFYGDAQGVVHPGAATEVPSLQNGGISADAKIWTFHLRPHLVLSDGQPYDARDVDYTWRLWSNPKFEAGTILGLNLINSSSVSADHLSITFHLKQSFAPFLADLWVDGGLAPLPAHHFSTMAPAQILTSSENRNPAVTSGPFMMAESKPGNHYTLIRNSHYYLADEGLPYLDKLVFRIVTDQNTILKDLQIGSIDSTWWLDVRKVQEYQHLKNYMFATPPTSANFEALFFNFHNTVLASHPEVRQAIAMAIDHQALIQEAYHGFATLLCTDHGSAEYPAYDQTQDCPSFDPVAANKLLDDNGWVMGPDGVRDKGGQRLEFGYSTGTLLLHLWRLDDELIIQRNMKAIGIKLDIQNYEYNTFFSSFLPGGKASPPSGAVAGRFDIAEFENGWFYDPDDSSMLSCNQIPPKGYNVDFYCNPALDVLYKQEQITADPGIRQKVFQQIHVIYLTQFPFIVLFSPPAIAIVSKGTHNYQTSDISGETNIAQWWCDNGKC